MHGHNIHSLATVNYQLPRGETLFHLPLTNIQEIFKDSSTTTRKYSKTFSACKFVLAANYQLYSGNIQRLFSNNPKIFKDFQQQQPAAATSSSNQQQQPAAATSSSNQQQQRAAATTAINSSNQQQQSTATINSNNQQQQSTASTSSSIRQQQSTTATTGLRPTSITSTIHDDPR